MTCVHSGAASTTEQTQRTALGYRKFRRQVCRRLFNERTDTPAWYGKERLTFSDALAVIRRELWSACHFSVSAFTGEMVKLPRSVLERLTVTVCYAA